MRKLADGNINRARLYVLILQHCSPNLKEVLKSISPWNIVSAGYDAIGFLEMVKDVASKLQGKKEPGRQTTRF